MRAFLLLAIVTSPLWADVELTHFAFNQMQGGTIGIGTPLTEEIGIQYGAVTSFSFANPCVGCGHSLALGTTGTFDYTAANTPDWDAFVANLTDGVDEKLGI